MNRVTGHTAVARSHNRLPSFPPNWRRRAPRDSITPRRRVSGRAGAGSLFPAEEGDLGRLVMDLNAIGIPTTENSFALRVEGNSMSGAGIQDGDILLVEKREPRSGEIVVAVVDGSATVKYYIVDGERQLLRAANPSYPDRELAGDWSIRAVAVGLIRKF